MIPYQPSWGLRLWIGLVIIFLLAPILVAILVSFNGGTQLSFPPKDLSLRWYFKLWTDRQLVAAFGLSLWIGAASTGLALVAGTTAALAINHYSFPGRAAIRTSLLLPLSLPGVVLGLGLLFSLSTFGLRPGVTATIIGHSVIGVPFILYFLLSVLANYDLDLDRASMNLGATQWQTFKLITLPLIRPGLQLGAVFAFLNSFDNVSLSLFLSKNDTLPLRLLQNLQFYSDPTVAAASGTIVAFSVILLFLVRKSLVINFDSKAAKVSP